MDRLPELLGGLKKQTPGLAYRKLLLTTALHDQAAGPAADNALQNKAAAATRAGIKPFLPGSGGSCDPCPQNGCLLSSHLPPNLGLKRLSQVFPFKQSPSHIWNSQLQGSMKNVIWTFRPGMLDGGWARSWASQSVGVPWRQEWCGSLGKGWWRPFAHHSLWKNVSGFFFGMS